MSSGAGRTDQRTSVHSADDETEEPVVSPDVAGELAPTDHVRGKPPPHRIADPLADRGDIAHRVIQIGVEQLPPAPDVCSGDFRFTRTTSRSPEDDPRANVSAFGQPTACSGRALQGTLSRVVRLDDAQIAFG